MIFGRNKHFLGVVTLYRTIGKEDFTYEDVFLMDMLKDHMAYRLSQDRNNQMTSQEKLTLTQAVKTYDLTKREQTILQLLLQGMENTEICDHLFSLNSFLIRYDISFPVYHTPATEHNTTAVIHILINI